MKTANMYASSDSTINNFIKWKRSLQRSRKCEDLETFTVKSKLALTAFVNRLIRAHRDESSTTSGSSCTQFTHNCLYIALRLCYELDLRSQRVVSEVIRELFLCEGELHAIFSIIGESHVTRGIPTNNNINIHTFTLYPGANARNFDDTVTHALSYYLRNIVRLDPDARENDELRYEFASILNNSSGGVESTTPLMAATKRKHVSLVHVLLRYGADPTISMHTDCDSPLVNPIQHIITCINSFASLKSIWLDTYLSKRNASTASEGRDRENCYQILRLFQRAVPGINMKVFPGLCGTEEQGVYFLHPSLASTVPHSRTPSLRHLCRCAIRKHVGKGVQNIPDAIACLPLPYIVKDFLDLKC